MFSRYESLYRGVPLITIPFFFDQFRNAELAQCVGYGKHLDINELSTNSLVGTIREMIANQSYSNKAKEISAVFKDNVMHPLDEAIWWIEHVAKFHGAKYLKSHSINMSWISYLLVDVIGSVILGIAFISYVLYQIIQSSCNKRRNRNVKQKAN